MVQWEMSWACLAGKPRLQPGLQCVGQAEGRQLHMPSSPAGRACRAQGGAGGVPWLSCCSGAALASPGSSECPAMWGQWGSCCAAVVSAASHGCELSPLWCSPCEMMANPERQRHITGTPEFLIGIPETRTPSGTHIFGVF